MLNAQTTAAFIDAQRLLQAVNGETITIAGTDYPCLAADLITGNRVWEQGGATQQITITVSVLKEDLPNTPISNTLATFRGLSLRIFSLNDADTFWQIDLIQQLA
jgi:hypothetical protein